MYGFGEVIGSDVNVFPKNLVSRYRKKDGVRMNYFETYSISFCSDTDDLVITNIKEDTRRLSLKEDLNKYKGKIVPQFLNK